MKLIYRLFFYIIIAGIFALSCSATVFASTGTVSGYAWSSEIGWINFISTTGFDAAMSDSGLTGFAWNENTGVINLDVGTNGWGVKNDGSGTLSGYAWNEGTGRINFSGVTVNTSTGKFSGTAYGDYNGQDNGLSINFSCDHCNVTTTWRPSSGGQTNNSGGGGGGVLYNPPTGPAAPSGGFWVKINNNALETNSRNVLLTFNAGSDAFQTEIATDPNFSDGQTTLYQPSQTFTLPAGDGNKILYVKFFNRAGGSSVVISANIMLDTSLPVVTTNNLQSVFGTQENVIFSGATKRNAELILLIDNAKYGIVDANNLGNWTVNLGQMSAGQHNIKIYAKDLANNIGPILTITFSVQTSVKTQSPSVNGNVPAPIITVPKQAPVALNGNSSVLPEKSIQQFVLTPLPTDVALLSSKFPQFKSALNQLGVAKTSDFSKLKYVNLNLPSLSDMVGFSGSNIPLESLSGTAKSKIPSNIVFNKVAGGTVDLNTSVAINTQGQVQKKITTVAGQPVQYIIKVDQPGATVVGYLVTKDNSASSALVNDVSASLTASDPNFTKVQKTLIAQGTTKVVAKLDFTDTGNGVYASTVSAPVSGSYEVDTFVQYQNPNQPAQEITMQNIVNPQGYVYQNSAGKYIGIAKATVSLYWLNPKTKKYELWPAKNYLQSNPQTTATGGTYSFLVPQGKYYLTASAPGFFSYKGSPFQATQGSGINPNIELKPYFWWINPSNWKL